MLPKSRQPRRAPPAPIDKGLSRNPGSARLNGGRWDHDAKAACAVLPYVKTRGSPEGFRRGVSRLTREPPIQQPCPTRPGSPWQNVT